MAEFSDKGCHCSHPYCKHLDLLPFTYDLCQAVFCKDHFQYDDHDCPKQAIKDSKVLVCPL